MPTKGDGRSLGLELRAAAVIGLAASLTHAACAGVGLSGGSLAYGSVIAALVVKPDFSRWPLPIYPLLLILVGVCMAIGVSLGLGLSNVPQVFVFGLVAALMQLITLMLPIKLRPLSGTVAVAGVLPLLGTPSWVSWRDEMIALVLGMAIGTLVQLVWTPVQRIQAKPVAPAANFGAASQAPEAPLPDRMAVGLRSPFFWRKLIFASLALAIGEGIGAVTPKYLYFGVVLLLNDSIGATLVRVRDRMVGVSLGVLMPLLVFNTFGISDVTIGLVMGGTAALVTALNCPSYLQTALISSGVAFIGYGPLVAWYIPHRWMDYLLGCALALGIGLLLFPQSALRRFNQLSAEAGKADSPMAGRELNSLLPAATEEALWLGLPKPQLPPNA